ncbi:MAG: OmpA family protein [Methylophilus sp.]|uniref:OmpA family protein n=1 Tax=Methylophilus sp. TaxID=29541 RepID=UPI003FA0ED4A
MIHKMRPIAVALISTLTLQGCAHIETAKQKAKETFASDDPCSNNARNMGILLGSVAGAIIGNKVGGDKTAGTLIGLGLGGALGAYIGVEIDKRECELSKIGKKYDLDMQVTPLAISATPTDKDSSNANANVQNVGLSVSITDIDGKSQFNSGSGELLTDAKIHFSEIAKQYSPIEQAKLLSADKTEQEKKTVVNELSKKRILLIGHTDDTGDTKLNAELSEKRAKAVAKVFKESGVSENQLFYQGSGETMPIADNNTPEGRAKNRRVEIVDLSSEEAFKLYLQNKRANTEYYRPVDNTSNVEQAAATGSIEIKPNQKQVNSAKKTKNKKTPSTQADKNENIETIAQPEVSVAENRTIQSSKKTNVAKSNTNSKTQEDSNKQVNLATASTIDFGGLPMSKQNNIVNIGNVEQKKSSFSLISQAQATDLKAISTCNLDRPRVSGTVKSLKDGKSYSTSDYLPGVYDSSWAGEVNGHLVALTHVAVLRDGGVPAGQPNLLIYQDYNPKSKKTPIYNSPANVNTYQGDKALLYRVFVAGPVQCIDIVIPNANPREAPNSSVVYKKNNEFYSSEFNPKLAKN